jgi:hypothetical protein
MKIEQTRWTERTGWDPQPPGRMGNTAQLVFVFAGTALIRNSAKRGEIRQAYPKARIMGCSTAGEIHGTQVTDDSMVVTAIRFERATLAAARIRIRDEQNSIQLGERLARLLKPGGLRHVFVLSNGLKVNGSDLVRGLTSQLPPDVATTGGLAGDGARFQDTPVLWDDEAEPDTVAVLGLYGAGLKVGHGSMGGWDPFGPERLITRSTGNVLHEFDGKSALALYKKYLGEHAQGLPATGLLFPLSIRARDGEPGVVRTILSIDEAEQSMTFAGDIPEGAYARLMKANFDRLIDGATGAARTGRGMLEPAQPELAILISCVGRKMVLRQRIEEEVEGVREILGPQAVLTGFYSYGEISPHAPGSRCELHNQTMTITTLAESRP